MMGELWRESFRQIAGADSLECNRRHRWSADKHSSFAYIQSSAGFPNPPRFSSSHAFGRLAQLVRAPALQSAELLWLYSAGSAKRLKRTSLSDLAPFLHFLAFSCYPAKTRRLCGVFCGVVAATLFAHVSEGTVTSFHLRIPRHFRGLYGDCFSLFLSTSGCRAKNSVLLRSSTVKVNGLMTQHRSRS